MVDESKTWGYGQGGGDKGAENCREVSTYTWAVRVENDWNLIGKLFTKVELHYMCPHRSLQAKRHNREAATQATENGETACLSVAK